MHSSKVTRSCRSACVASVAIILFIYSVIHFGLDYIHSDSSYWQSAVLKGGRLWDSPPIEPQWIWNHTTDAQNLMLTHLHCEQAFHGLFSTVDQSVRHYRVLGRRIRKSDIDRTDGLSGVVHAMIYSQRLYVISSGGLMSHHSFTVLSQIHRALITSPEEVPDIEFTFLTDPHHSIDDAKLSRPHAIPWTFMRSPTDSFAWLMPDFTFSASASTSGRPSFHELRTRAEAIDEAVSWSEKRPQLLWRGTTSTVAMKQAFFETTEDATWADIRAVNAASTAPPAPPADTDVDEHCRSKYLAHTDGASYSGRLKYLQLCNSVILAEPSRWVTFDNHLLRKDGPDQNYLPVKEDWSDVASKVRHLQSWDTLGERIARNSVETFRDRFLTPAAEVCSWRRLLKGWAEVLDFKPELWEVQEDGTHQERGVLYERLVMDMLFT